ncbi:MAG TPA: hypothetical protein VLI07_18865 [Candidatus Binatus sp.]|nr:hypothetical protein [Candidatus Binatus sp.]
MPYAPTNWVDGATPVNRATMKNIEDELVLLDGRPVVPTVVNGKWLRGSGGAVIWDDITPTTVPIAGQANGFATLDATGKIPVAQLPAAGIAGMTKFADTVLGASAANIDLQSIPQTALHLMLRMLLRSDAAVTGVNVALRFNNDSGADYWDVALSNQAAAPTGVETLSATLGLVGFALGASAVAGYFGDVTVNIGDYAAARQHNWTSVTHALWSSTTSTHLIRAQGGAHALSPAITRITIIPGSGNFIAGSRVTLYGLN